jgi:pyruvate dehydrogenase E2 component (dihydrolipoamide acetyltransferase)
VQVPIAVIGQQGEDISGLISQADGSGATSESLSDDSVKQADGKQADGKQADAEASADSVAGQPPASATAVSATAVSETGVSANADRTAGSAQGKGDGDSVGGISPRARHLAEKHHLPAAGITGTGPKGRIIERDIQAAVVNRQPLTPSAAAAASGGSYSVPESGSGIGGRVRQADIAVPAGSQPDAEQTAARQAAGQAAVQAAVQASAVHPAAVSSALPFPGPAVEIPVRSIRKITAKRMLESITTTCQLTLHASANAVRLKELRARFKTSNPELGLSGISINDLVLFAAVKTLKQFRFVNSHFLGDRIVEFEHVHLGQAVDTERGLMVPVISYADLRSLRDLAAESKRLVAACKSGKAAPEELEGGTFTVTNLGALGIERFTPVLNNPQTAILGVNAIELKAIEIEDREGDVGVEFIPHIGLSLTFDHQAYDGAPAARFLQALTANIRDIDLLTAL